MSMTTFDGNRRICLLNERNLALNIFEPEDGVDPLSYASSVSDMFSSVAKFQLPAARAFLTAVVQTYRKFGVLDGGATYPCIHDIYLAIKRGNAHPQVKGAILNTINPILMSSIGAALAYRKGWPTRILARQHVVLDLSSSNEAGKATVVQTLLLKEFTRRMASSDRSEKLMVTADDAARLVGNGSPLIQPLGVMRSLGISVELNCQYDAEPGVLAHCANLFIGASAPTNVDKVARLGRLSSEERDFLLKLNPGEYIGILGESNDRKANLFRFPRVSGSGGSIRPEAALPEELLCYPTVKATEFRNWPNIDVSQAENVKDRAAKQQSNQLSDAELRFVIATIDNPGVPSSELAKLAHVSTRTAVEIRHNLVEQGYLREHTINTGKRGRASLVLEPLEAAMVAVGRVELKS